MNAAAALYISDFAKNYAEGLGMAKEALAQGKAYGKLLELKEFQESCTRAPQIEQKYFNHFSQAVQKHSDARRAKS